MRWSPETGQFAKLAANEDEDEQVAGKRKNYSADFTAKVALEAIRGEVTIAELVAKHGVHQTVIHSWKRQALEGMAAIFSGKVEAKAAEKEGEIEKLRGPDRPTGGGAGFFGQGRASEGAIGSSPLASGR